MFRHIGPILNVYVATKVWNSRLFEPYIEDKGHSKFKFKSNKI
jgi:hypothetical protein